MSIERPDGVEAPLVSSGVNAPAQAREVSRRLSARFGDNLLAVYLYGSFVNGGLQAQSDIDLLAVVREPLADTERGPLMRDLLMHSAYPARDGLRPLEVTCLALSDIHPWRHPARRDLQFGEWLRADLEAGRVPGAEMDPDVALLVRQARDNGIALYGPEASALLPEVPQADIRDAMLAMMPEVARHWRGEERHALLTLARMWVTLRTGEIVAKDAAVARIRGELPPEHLAVLEHAVAIHRGETEDDLRHQQARVEACVGYLASAIRQPV